MNAPKYSVLQKIKNGKRTYGITPRISGGFITPKQLRLFADVAEKYKGVLKLTSGQRIAILNILPEDVDNAWQDLGMEPGVLSSYSVKNIEMCPASFCKRAKQNSVKLGMRLEKKYYGASTPNRTKIVVVGCRNACCSAHAKDIAVIGDYEGYRIAVGGSAGFHPRMPDIIAVDLSEDEAFNMVGAVYDHYNRDAEPGEKLGVFIDRIGLDEYKKSVLKLYNENNKSLEEENEDE